VEVISGREALCAVSAVRSYAEKYVETKRKDFEENKMSEAEVKETEKKIQITVQREDRLMAIRTLSSAINKVASALLSPVQIAVRNCTIIGDENSTGISIATEEKTAETTEI